MLSLSFQTAGLHKLALSLLPLSDSVSQKQISDKSSIEHLKRLTCDK